MSIFSKPIESIGYQLKKPVIAIPAVTGAVGAGIGAGTHYLTADKSDTSGPGMSMGVGAGIGSGLAYAAIKNAFG